MTRTMHSSATDLLKILAGFMACCLLFSCGSQRQAPVWISHREAIDTGYGVFLFRNAFQVDELPGSLNIHVSADNRYKLYLNGEIVGLGPARGDLPHWRYETYDIAPLLETGKNVLAALVWNMGEGMPVAQHSDRTGFCLFAETRDPHRLATGTGKWEVMPDPAYHAIEMSSRKVRGYYASGSCDSLRLADHPHGWKTADDRAGGWKPAVIISPETVRWNLVERNIPDMEYRTDNPLRLVRIEGLTDNAGPADLPLTVPPGKKISLLFDQEYLTIGYPRLRFSGGGGSSIRLTYAEALRDKYGRKGNRNEIAGKQILGYYDYVIPDGEADREFIPLWLRTLRYVQLDIETTDAPLTIDAFENIYSAYPVTMDGSFQADDPVLDRFMEVGWRTLRLCSGETYFDCPYYEQLQYVGDTRIQALITLYLSRDDRLVRNAISQFHDSFLPEGITASRYPSNLVQKIPPYSLYWISMIYDYYLMREDTAFLEPLLDDAERVIAYFEPYLHNGMMGPMPTGRMDIRPQPEYWYFVDWTREYRQGRPKGIHDNQSSIFSLHYAITLREAAYLMEAFDRPVQAAKYLRQAEEICRGVMRRCYHGERGLIAQTPDQTEFSQHANILGILSDAVPASEQVALMQRLLADETLIQASVYYRFYLFQALVKVGMGDEYLEQLEFWHRALDEGLTTFPEKQFNTRSDCHAWSSSPCYDFMATVAGIRPTAPGMASVSIRPHFGHLKRIEASMPHPYGGAVEVDLRREDSGKVSGEIILPEGVDGILTIGEGDIPLVAGSNRIGT